MSDDTAMSDVSDLSTKDCPHLPKSPVEIIHLDGDLRLQVGRYKCKFNASQGVANADTRVNDEIKAHGHETPVVFIVSAQNVAQMSKVFHTMLFSGNAQSKRPDTAEGPWVVKLPENIVDGMRILLAIGHMRFDLVPSTWPTQDNIFDWVTETDILLSVALAADKYDCKHILRPWATQWIRKGWADYQRYKRRTVTTMRKWLHILWFLGDAWRFARCFEDICTNECTRNITGYLCGTLQDAVMSKRIELIHKIVLEYDRAVKFYSKRRPETSEYPCLVAIDSPEFGHCEDQRTLSRVFGLFSIMKNGSVPHLDAWDQSAQYLFLLLKDQKDERLGPWKQHENCWLAPFRANEALDFWGTGPVVTDDQNKYLSAQAAMTGIDEIIEDIYLHHEKIEPRFY